MWALLSRGPQVLPGACSSTGSLGYHSPHQPAVTWGPPWLTVNVGSTADMHGRHHGLRGNLCSSTQNTFPSFTELNGCRGVSLTYSHSPLPWLQFSSAQLFSPFFKTWPQKHHCCQWPSADPSRTKSWLLHWTGRNLMAVPQQNYPCIAFTTKTLPLKPNRRKQLNGLGIIVIPNGTNINKIYITQRISLG